MGLKSLKDLGDLLLKQVGIVRYSSIAKSDKIEKIESLNTKRHLTKSLYLLQVRTQIWVIIEIGDYGYQ